MTKPQNSGYRDCEVLLRSHPKIEVVSKLEDADFIFYWSWGDDPKINGDIWCDMEKPFLADITGDGCWIPNQSSGLYFTTHPSVESTCFQIPYSYRRFSDGKNLPNPNSERKILASFQGSMNTNPKRRELLKLKGDGVVINEQDGWNNLPGVNERIIIEHDYILSNSKFTFCPVGIGLSSIRVIEAIFHGSIPILIGDDSKPFGDELEFSVRSNNDGWSINPECLRAMPQHEYESRLFLMNQFKDKFLLRDANQGIHNELGYLDWIYEKALNYSK